MDHRDPTDERRERRLGLALAVLFTLVMTVAGLDLIADLGEGATPLHLAAEGTVAGLGLAGAVWMAARTRALSRRARALSAEARALREQTAELAADLDHARAESARWRDEAADLIRGLGDAIDRQLARWGLTPAEQEIALLLLKGLSHKEVAAVREVSESTVRQQAGAIYRKAGLGGRHDLAAFFLEDLLTRPAVALDADGAEPAGRAEPAGPAVTSRAPARPAS